MMLLTFGLVASFAVTIQSALIPKSYVLHEKRDLETGSAKKWVKRERLPSDTILPMRIGLKQQNLHNGYDLLMDVSHPSSSNYGKHWTSKEVIDRFAPEQDTVNQVIAWLVDFGIHPDRIIHTENKGWLAFNAATEEVEALLHAEYHIFQHTSLHHMTAACDSYHVPKHIQEHVDYLTPGIKLSAPPKKSKEKRAISIKPSGIPPSAAGSLSICDQFMTPDCIKALYKVPPNPEYPNGKARSDNSLGIFEWDDTYHQDDLNAFFANFTPYIPRGTHPKAAFIDGGDAPDMLDDSESALDFEIAYPLIYPQTITLYQTDDKFYHDPPNGNFKFGFNTFLDALDGSYCKYTAFGETGDDPLTDPIYPDPQGYDRPEQCGAYKPTNVISVSWGDEESDYPHYYQQRQCNEFMKLGLQGHSIFFSSGDTGVAAPPRYGNNYGCLGEEGNIFSPGYPVSCPYLTVVGGTMILPGHGVNDTEIAVYANNVFGNSPITPPFTSGGGFSNIYSAPDYQKNALDHYFANHEPSYPYYNGGDNIGNNGGIYNRLGRGYPDVSANGLNTLVYAEGYFGLSGGTSASAPIWASLITRINEIRLNAGKSTVGFINPVIYTNTWIFNDIVNGTSSGCSTNGFEAVEGWDPVTGLGTPNYEKMVQLWTSLP